MIHHTQMKKAQKLGYMLAEKDDLIEAFYPRYNLRVYCVSASKVIDWMTKAVEIKTIDDTYQIEPIEGDLQRVNVIHDGEYLASPDGEPMTPPMAAEALQSDDLQWLAEPEFGASVALPKFPAPEPAAQIDELERLLNVEERPRVTIRPDGTIAPLPPVEPHPKPEVARNNKGVPLNGLFAWREKFTAADNPYSYDEEDEAEKAEAWDEEFDNAADDTEKGGSVVSEKYRLKYAEQGHPEHCGDWLAETFNNLVKTKEGTDIPRVYRIAELNGINLDKYNRSNPGWQGRLRMTCRNLLARVIWMAGGKFTVPVGLDDGTETLTAPAEWMSAQRFKSPKK